MFNFDLSQFLCQLRWKLVESSKVVNKDIDFYQNKATISNLLKDVTQETLVSLEEFSQELFRSLSGVSQTVQKNVYLKH